MHLESTITALGLPAKSAKVYLTSLQLGPATMTQVSKAAGFKRPTTYLIIDDLLRRGFVTTSQKGAKTLYHAEAPRKLLNLVHFRARQLEQILPELEALYDEPKEKPRIKIYEGIEAMKRVYDDVYAQLGKRHEALFYTPVGDIEATHPEILKYFTQQLKGRRDYCIRELLRGDEASIAYAKRMKSLQGHHHHIRLLDQKFSFCNTDNFIFGNKLIIFSLRSEIFVIEIENSDIADTYRALFNAAWEYGREV